MQGDREILAAIGHSDSGTGVGSRREYHRVTRLRQRYGLGHVSDRLLGRSRVGVRSATACGGIPYCGRRCGNLEKRQCREETNKATTILFQVLDHREPNASKTTATDQLAGVLPKMKNPKDGGRCGSLAITNGYTGQLHGYGWPKAVSNLHHIVLARGGDSPPDPSARSLAVRLCRP